MPNLRQSLLPAVAAVVLLLAGLLPVLARSTEPLEVYYQQFPGGAEMRARNNTACDATVSLEIDLVNATASPAVPLSVTVPAHEDVCLTTLRQKTRGIRWEYAFRYHYIKGSKDAEHDDSVVYRLPYASGKGYRVLQGPDGTFSHQGEMENAVDWKMPVGTPVLAARDGTVVDVVDTFTAGGPDPRLMDKGNVVLVRHPDGTLGEYLHLQRGGAKVRIGQTVRAGDLIGLSGNTGWTSEPHLHFMVFRAVDGYKRESIAINFRVDGRPDPVSLEEGKSYRAP